MPEFVNPFSGAVPREMTHGELVRAIMLDIAAELEAVHLYLAHMDATSDEDAKKVLFDVAQEELVHAGEFTSLLYRLDPITGAKAQEGFREVSELLDSRAPSEVTASDHERPEMDGGSAPTPEGLTVGSLIDPAGQSKRAG
jgi:rubrerythrin